MNFCLVPSLFFWKICFRANTIVSVSAVFSFPIGEFFVLEFWVIIMCISGTFWKLLIYSALPQITLIWCCRSDSKYKLLAIIIASFLLMKTRSYQMLQCVHRRSWITTIMQHNLLVCMQRSTRKAKCFDFMDFLKIFWHNFNYFCITWTK